MGLNGLKTVFIPDSSDNIQELSQVVFIQKLFVWHITLDQTTEEVITRKFNLQSNHTIYKVNFINNNNEISAV